jgi:hypothetical protein
LFFFQTLHKAWHRHPAGTTEIQRFNEIYAALADLGFGNKGLWLLELLGQFHLAEACLFTDFPEE